MLFTPTRAYKCILDVTPEILKEMNVTALILDIDNTMTTHDNKTAIDGIFEWLDVMRENNIKMTIVSNNHPERVEPFAKMLNLSFIADGAKPLASGYKRASIELDVPKEQICTIGDQLFTDILGAKVFGIKSILVPPIEYEKTTFFKIKRTAEKPFLPKHYEGENEPKINGKNIREVKI